MGISKDNSSVFLLISSVVVLIIFGLFNTDEFKFKLGLEYSKLLPDYDRKITHNETDTVIQSKFHEDRNITSKILNDVLLSFRWRAIINAELIADFKLWAAMEDHQVPDVVFIGDCVFTS